MPRVAPMLPAAPMRAIPPEMPEVAVFTPEADAAPVPAAAPGRLLRPVLLLCVLLAAGLLLRRLPGGEGGLLPAVAVLRHGVSGPLLFLLAGSLMCAVGLPRQAVCFAGGIAYGLPGGVALSSLATLTGCLLGFGWARLAGHDWARRRLARHPEGWLSRLDRLAAARPFGTVLTLRLLPVGSSLALNLAAGVLGTPVLPFAAATLLGSLPQTVVFTLLGHGTRIGHDLQIVIAVVLFVLSGIVGLILLRRSPGS